MKVRQKFMSIQDMLSIKDEINLNPPWQRGPVWSTSRRALLIDSILRDMDIPKIYLLLNQQGSAFMYDAVDGQQRLRSIFDFADGSLELHHTSALPPIDGIEIAGHTLNTLGTQLTQRFLKFKVSVAEITSADYDQVRQLFLRLQMGVALIPAELRNAVGGPIRNIIDTMALADEFFAECRIGKDRYKHQDYLAHVFTLADLDGDTDLKASDLRALYEKYSSEQTDAVLDLMAKVGKVLDVLVEVNRSAGYRITQKWIFVDLFWLIYSSQQIGVAVDSNIIAEKYKEFAERRRRYSKLPELLLDPNRAGVVPTDVQLYSYIQAFRASGGDRDNLQIRRDSLRLIFGNIGGI